MRDRRDCYWRVGGTGPLVRVEAYDRAATPRYDVYALMGSALFGVFVGMALLAFAVAGR